MFIFDFYCNRCGIKKEIIVKDNREMVFCCICNRSMERLPSAPAFHLKGNGWARDNYGLKQIKKKENKTN